MALWRSTDFALKPANLAVFPDGTILVQIVSFSKNGSFPGILPGVSGAKGANRVAWPRQKTNLSREEAHRQLVGPGNLFADNLDNVLRKGHQYAFHNFLGQKFSGQVEFVRQLRGFCLTVRQLNDALLWFTIEGVPGKIEVQAWLSAFGLAQSRVDEFARNWQARPAKIFANRSLDTDV
jgi:hypothetical protein